MRRLFRFGILTQSLGGGDYCTTCSTGIRWEFPWVCFATLKFFGELQLISERVLEPMKATAFGGLTRRVTAPAPCFLE